MEKIEEKTLDDKAADFIENRGGVCGSVYDDFADTFIGGYTTRNDEVVKMVEGRIAYLETFPKDTVEVELNEAYMFLQELTKLKEDKK